MADILQKKEWNTRQVVYALLIVASITFSATLVWVRFLSVEKDYTTLSDRVEKKDARVNESIDKLEARIKELEKTHK
jgi:cell division protein FtsL